MEYIKGEPNPLGKTPLEQDLRKILREFYDRMKDIHHPSQPVFNKGLGGICTYDEAIEKIIQRTAFKAMYEALSEIVGALDEGIVPTYIVELIEIANKALALARRE